MSSPWNSLLESLHSALIDEFNGRFPDEKPSLGLPLRQGGFTPPDKAKKLLVLQVKLATGEGVAFISSSDSGDDVEGVWKAVVKRAEPEFQRRGIAPSWTRVDPARVPKLSRSVWIPLEIRSQWYLGIGV